MRQLSRLQSAVFAAGALLMLAGAVAAAVAPAVAPWVFAVGAVAYVAIQAQQRYEGSSFTLLRLRRILLISDGLLLLTALLMVADRGNSLGLDSYTYVNYVHNKWFVCLLLAAAIQLFCTYRIDAELRREAKKR